MSACLDCGCHGGDHFTHCPRRGQQHLAVNINADCAEALRRIKAARGITTTEAIRRAISLLDYFEKSAAPACSNCGHPIAWHDAEEDDMCARSDCFCQEAK